MGEGFGDYWAVSNTYEVSILRGFDPACFGEWDAVPGCLRKTDSPKKYSNLVGECHLDGEIWSSALWAILGEVGKTVADRIILRSHMLISETPTFASGVAALLLADSELYLSQHRDIICDQMRFREIYTAGCAWEPWGATLQENHPWSAVGPDNQPISLNPVGGVLTLDTRTIPVDGNNAALGILTGGSNLGIPTGTTTLHIRLKAIGFYNQGLVYPCWPYGFYPEYGQITLRDSSTNSINIKVMVGPPPPELQGRPYIQATDTFSVYEVPINNLTGTINSIEVYAFANRADQIVCPPDLVPNPYRDAYFVLDLDHIDFRF